MKNQDWLLQKTGYGIGNFLMMTPAIRAMYEYFGWPVNVFFEDQAIKECYNDCKYISALRYRPTTKPLNKASMNPYNGTNEYVGWIKYFNQVLDIHMSIEYYKAAIPPVPRNNVHSNMVALVHGCSNLKLYKDAKDIGISLRQQWITECIKDGKLVLILGNQSDYDTYWKHNDLSSCHSMLGRTTLREACSLLARCESFYANDTGLAHVGSAMGLKGYVYWKDTDYDRCCMPSEYVDNVRLP